jgi:hypothetical protein
MYSVVYMECRYASTHISFIGDLLSFSFIGDLRYIDRYRYSSTDLSLACVWNTCVYSVILKIVRVKQPDTKYRG